MQITQLEFTYLDGDRRDQKVPVSSPYIVLGSAEDADVRFAAGTVLATHAVIRLTSDGYCLFPVSQPLKVNAQVIWDDESYILASQDVIELVEGASVRVEFAGSPRLEPTSGTRHPEPGPESERALQVEVFNSAQQPVFTKTFRQPTVQIGSSKACAIVLPDNRIAARQLLIREMGDGYYYIPFGQEPITVDGTTLRKEELVKPGQRVKLPGFEIVVNIQGTFDQDIQLPGTNVKGLEGIDAADTGHSGPAELTLMAGAEDGGGVVWAGKAMMLRLGSNAECDIVFSPDDGVAPLHAVCAWLDGHYVLCDRSSEHDTEMAGEPLDGRPISLADGDTVRLARARPLVFRLAPPQSPDDDSEPGFKLEAVAGPLRGRTYYFSSASETLGNEKKGNSLRLQSPDDGLFKALVEARPGGGHLLISLKGQKPTVNGSPIANQCRLYSTDRLALPGGHEFVYEPLDPIAGDPAGTVPSHYGLRIWSQSWPKKDHPFGSPWVLVGRSKLNDVKVDDPAAPDCALLALTGPGCALVLCRPEEGLTFEVSGKPHAPPFRLWLEEQLLVRGELHLEMFEFQHTSGPVGQSSCLYSLREGNGQFVSEKRIQSERVTAVLVGSAPEDTHLEYVSPEEVSAREAELRNGQAQGLVYSPLAQLVSIAGDTVIYPLAPGAVRVDGVECCRPTLLDNGNRILFGPDRELLYSTAAATASPARPPSEPSPVEVAPSVPGGALAPIEGYALEILGETNPDGSPAIIQVSSCSYSIGRSEQCNLVFSDQHVSRQHARIERDGDGHVLHGVSAHGTFVDGAPVKEHRLRNGDVFEFGDGNRVRYKLPVSLQRGAARSGGSFFLVCEDGEFAEEPLELQGPTVTLGRSKDRNVRLAHPSVSRDHAQIQGQGGRWWILSRGSTPVWVDELEVKGQTELKDGCRIRFPGDTTFRFELPRGEERTVPLGLAAPGGPSRRLQRVDTQRLEPARGHEDRSPSPHGKTPEGEQPSGPAPRQGSSTDEEGIPFRLRVLKGPWRIGKEFTFCKQAVWLGRGADCDLDVDDRAVKSQQALISVQDGQLVLQSRNRSAPTKVDGAPAQGQPLEDNSVIELAPGVELEFLLGEAPDEQRQEKSSPALATEIEKPRRSRWLLALLASALLLAMGALVFRLLSRISG